MKRPWTGQPSLTETTANTDIMDGSAYDKPFTVHIV